MVNWVLRGAVLLWAVFFTILGAQGLLDPATYTETFGIAVDGAAANTVRADLSAFFLVAAGSAAIGALVRGWTGALLYGTALAGRLIGAALGDAVGAAIVQAMIIEALTLLLMAGSWWVLSGRASRGDTVAAAADTLH
jgi:hypothetical protein